MFRKAVIFLALVAMIAFAGGIAFRSSGTIAVGAEKEASAKTAFLDRLKVGDAIAVEEKQGRYQLGIFPKTFRPLSHSIVQVESDFVVVRDLAGVTDTAIPIFSIASIKTLRIGGK